MSIPFEIVAGIALLMVGFGVLMLSLAVCSHVNLESRMYDDNKKAQEEIKRVRQAAEKALEKPELIAKLQADHIRRTLPVQ